MSETETQDQAFARRIREGYNRKLMRDARFDQTWCCIKHYDGVPLLQPTIVCLCCGNKRCPKASNHRLPCTQSNDPGQPGSVYLDTTHQQA